MGSFKLGGISLRGVFGTSPCKLYPVKTPEYFAKTKGHIENIAMKDCILCGLCAKKCPTSAIEVDKAAETWTIDPFSCIQCSSCVHICPKDCLIMVNTYTDPAPVKSTVTHKKPALTDEEKATKEQAAVQKAERVKAAQEKAANKRDAESKGDDLTQ
jgi:formate hydrogenlyase subunit 6/NADH:ubiquinone oxidoreductase subunit I